MQPLLEKDEKADEISETGAGNTSLSLSQLVPEEDVSVMPVVYSDANISAASRRITTGTQPC